jgi:hypothetical protein
MVHCVRRSLGEGGRDKAQERHKIEDPRQRPPPSEWPSAGRAYRTVRSGGVEDALSGVEGSAVANRESAIVSGVSSIQYPASNLNHESPGAISKREIICF